MDDHPKIHKAWLSETGAGIKLRMHTVEGIEVAFDLDDLAAAMVGISVSHALEASRMRPMLVYVRASQ